MVLAAGTAIRVLAGPGGGRLADRTGNPRLILCIFTAASAVVALGYVPARTLPLLFLVSVAHAAVLAPLTPVADALALGSANEKPFFEYGWVRGTGSAAFILGTLLAGQFVGSMGLGVIIWFNAGLLAVAAVFAWGVPNRVAGVREALPKAGATRALLAMPVYRRAMLVAALIGGSHALHDGFEVIRWRAAGLSAGEASLLWSMSVAAEVLVFVFFGQGWLRRLGTGRAMMVSAGAGIVRWGTAAMTAQLGPMAVVEPLHGFTFALLHLACMDIIARTVPVELASTAQAFYGTIAMGAAAAVVTLASGSLYGQFGAAAFWAMAVMCALALPVARSIHLSLQETPTETVGPGAPV